MLGGINFGSLICANNCTINSHSPHWKHVTPPLGDIPHYTNPSPSSYRTVMVKVIAHHISYVTVTRQLPTVTPMWVHRVSVPANS